VLAPSFGLRLRRAFWTTPLVAGAMWAIGSMRPLAVAVLVGAVTWFILELLPTRPRLK
jgi:hypothetical protein